VHQDRKRLPIAFPCPLDEVSIHLDLRIAAGKSAATTDYDGRLAPERSDDGSVEGGSG